MRDRVFKGLVATDEFRLWKAILQTPNERVRLIAKFDCTYAFCRRCHEDRTKRALANRKVNDVTIPARAKLGGCHPQQVVRFRIKPAIGIEPSTVDRLSHRLATH